MGLFDRESNTATMERQKPASTTPEASNAPSQAQTAPKPAASAPAPAMMPAGKMTSRMAFKVRWTNPEGEVVCETMQVLSSTGKGMGQIRKPEGWPSGTYRMEILINDMPAAMMDFEVR